MPASSNTALHYRFYTGRLVRVAAQLVHDECEALRRPVVSSIISSDPEAQILLFIKCESDDYDGVQATGHNHDQLTAFSFNISKFYNLLLLATSFLASSAYYYYVIICHVATDCF